MKVRTGLVVIAIAGATFAGSAVASAASGPEPLQPTSPTADWQGEWNGQWTEDCLAHHPELTEEDIAAMHEAMEAGDFGSMASTMGGAWGSVAPMMGGGMGHHGQLGWGA